MKTKELTLTPYLDNIYDSFLLLILLLLGFVQYTHNSHTITYSCGAIFPNSNETANSLFYNIYFHIKCYEWLDLEIVSHILLF